MSPSTRATVEPALDSALLWNLPNTLIGIAWAAVGLPLGARVRVARETIEVTRHPFMLRGCAVTLGQVVAYARDVDPDTLLARGVRFRDHERQHVTQGEVLGPLYLCSQVLGGLLALARDRRWHGPSNWNERGPRSEPPRPWA